MAYRYGIDRNQLMMLPPVLDQYVTHDHPVRTYDAFVEALNFRELGISLDERKVWQQPIRSSKHVEVAFVRLLLRVRSSRKLEQEVHNNLSFIWLMRQLKP